MNLKTFHLGQNLLKVVTFTIRPKTWLFNMAESIWGYNSISHFKGLDQVEIDLS